MSENGEIDGAGLEDTHPMEPDHEACYRALPTRDARFDGRFFIAVRTTRVYCRPICPARTPKRENVTFFATASAAQEAGYRPCLRCRPESSPDLGAWRGTSNTVSRALTLIGEGALDGEAVDALAERLGGGERQLRRLFRQHLGASPIAVAQTRRVLFAKQLIIETTMPMAEVALAAGFNSIRRFNATFQTLYQGPPRALRRSRLADAEQPGAEGITLKLPYAPPYDWDAMIDFLGARAIRGIEAVDGRRCYRRSIALDRAQGVIRVEPDDRELALRVSIRFPRKRVAIERAALVAMLEAADVLARDQRPLWDALSWKRSQNRVSCLGLQRREPILVIGWKRSRASTSAAASAARVCCSRSILVGEMHHSWRPRRSHGGCCSMRRVRMLCASCRRSPWHSRKSIR